MLKAVALGVPFRSAAKPISRPLLWPLLLGELAMAALLLSGGNIPDAALQALRLFLRF